MQELLTSSSTWGDSDLAVRSHYARERLPQWGCEAPVRGLPLSRRRTGAGSREWPPDNKAGRCFTGLSRGPTMTGIDRPNPTRWMSFDG